MQSLSSLLIGSFIERSECEIDPTYQSVLRDVLHTSLRQCGAVGLVGTVLYVGLGVLGLGYELHWTYQPFGSPAPGEQVVVLGTLMVAALSTIGLVLAQMECRLRIGRLFGVGAVLVTATVAMFEGALRDGYGTQYVVPMYLIIVAIVPFRPRYVLGMGGAVAAIVYVLGPSGPAWTGTTAITAEMVLHLAFVAGSTVLVTGTSMVLYRRHCSFAKAQAELQKNRDQLRRAQSMAQLGGWTYDSETGTLTGTAPFYRLLDLPMDAPIDIGVVLRMYPLDARRQLRTALDRCLEDGTPFDLELPLDLDTEEQCWSRVQGEARETDGETTRVTGTFQDITCRKHREQEIERERDRFETLFDNLPSPAARTLLTDDGAHIQTVNQAFESAFGTDADAVTGEHLHDLLDEGTAQTEVRRTTPAGPRDFQLQVAMRNGGETCPEAYAVFLDITERKRRERTLREREEKIKALYTATEHLLRVDHPSAVAERIETVIEDTFQYPLNTVRLAEDEALVPPRVSTDAWEPPDEPRPTVYTREGLARLYRSGETVVARNQQDVDTPVDFGPLRTVAFLPIAEHGLVSIGAREVGRLDPFDLRLLEILSAQASAVLDRLDRERDLQRSEKRFRGIFENVTVGIALLDGDGTIVKSNPALQSMMKCGPERLEGRSLTSFTHPDDLNTDQILLDQLVAGKQESFEVEKRFVRTNGDGFWGTLTISRQNGSGDGQVICMIEDIDERKRHKRELKRTKKEAEEMNRLKSAFLANMSHEIRTPLTSILGFAEAIEDAAVECETTDVPLEEFANRIMKGGNRLLSTLDAILNFSKLESGTMDLSIRPVSLNERAEAAVDHFQRKAEESGIDLRSVSPPSPVWTPADQGALRRILRNLLNNALKYTETGGTVWVRVRSRKNRAVIEVEDTGIGMDPDEVPTLFEAFRQGSTGVQRSYEGNGLGLAIVQRLVHRLEGTINVDTEKGVGTRITVRLPLASHGPDPNDDPPTD